MTDDLYLEDKDDIKDYKYNVEPLGRPEAGKLITAFNFDVFRRRLTITLSENKKMDAYRWIVSIKDLYDQAGLHSHLLGKDQIVLHLFDGNEEFATIRFGRLMLESHHCSVSSDKLNQELEHQITVGFEKYEIHDIS